MTNLEFTILSVYHSEKTRRFTELNYEALKRLNPNASFEWLVADNAPADLSPRLDGAKFKIYPGVGKLPEKTPKWAYPSFYHTLALQKIAPLAKTRFVLVLDADFLIVYPNWINEVTDYMSKNKIGIFGAPYHPRDFTKPRYFPSAPCMFFDTSLVDIKNADFRPQYPSILAAIDGREYRESLGAKLFRKLKMLVFGGRYKIGHSRDSASYFYNKYFKSDIKSDTLKPVFKMERDFMGPTWAKSRWNRFLEKLLPERLSFIPKKKNYFSGTGFRERGYYDIAGLGLEEYLWNDRPFGFHFRGTFATKRTPEEEVRLAEEAVKNFGYATSKDLR